MLKLYIFIIALLLSVKGNSQSLLYKEIDSLSNRYLLLKDTKGYETLLNTVCQQDKDNFIIRYRYGVLLFDKGLYTQAEKQFKLALTYNTKDKIILTYLYYCQSLKGNEDLAEFNLNNVPISLQEKLIIKKKTIIQSVEITGGFFPDYNLNNSLFTKSNPTTNWLVPNNDPLYVTQSKNSTLQLAQITLQSKLHSRWIMNNSLSAYNLKKETTYKIANSYFPFNSNLLQIDYAHYSKVFINTHWQLNLGYHFCKLNKNNITLNSISAQFIPTFLNVNNTMYNHLFLIGARRYLNNGFIEPEFSYTYINGNAALQTSYFQQYNLTSKPLIYIAGKVSLLNQSTGTNLVYHPLIGYGINRFYSGEFSVHYGSMLNYNEQYGQILYNLADDIRLKFSLNNYFSFTNRLGFNVFLSYMQRQSSMVSVYPQNVRTDKIPYNQLALVCGIKWKL